MPLILGLAMTAALAAKPDCSWDRPGINPFMGDIVQAVNRYTDIAPEIRNRLKQRMQARQYDDIVSIRRDRIEGKFSYDPALRDMHFGSGSVCAQVSRSKWSDAAQERGLVYCEKDQCIIVPTVCRNVSRITRRANAGVGAGTGGPAAGALPVPVLVIEAPVLHPALAGIYAPGLSTTNPAPEFFGDKAPLTGPAPFGEPGPLRFEPHLPANVILPPTPFPSVPSVPESPTWALLLAGLGLLAARRPGGKARAA